MEEIHGHLRSTGVMWYWLAFSRQEEEIINKTQALEPRTSKVIAGWIFSYPFSPPPRGIKQRELPLRAVFFHPRDHPLSLYIAAASFVYTVPKISFHPAGWDDADSDKMNIIYLSEVQLFEPTWRPFGRLKRKYSAPLYRSAARLFTTACEKNWPFTVILSLR